MFPKEKILYTQVVEVGMDEEFDDEE